MTTKKYYIPSSLLTTNNAKTIKGKKLFDITTYILYLAPHKQNSLGKNICPNATAGCSKACLYGAGRGSLSNVQTGRTNKAEFFLQDKSKFLTMLYIEIAQIELKHKLEGTKFAIRLNGTSDISYESLKIEMTGKSLMESFPSVTFYDYTKNNKRFKKQLPANYTLVFSRSETNGDVAKQLLNSGISIAVVFDKLPETYMGVKVINGDLSDARFLDEKQVVVGLTYKTLTEKGADNKIAFESGFVVRQAA